MDLVVLLFFSHILALAVGLMFGRLVGYGEAQPKRDRRGRFIKGG